MQRAPTGLLVALAGALALPLGAAQSPPQAPAASAPLLLDYDDEIGAARTTVAATCESLASLPLPQATITSAQSVPPGSFAPPPSGRAGRGPNPFTDLPAFCRVAATLTPTSDSDIKIEVWLPTSAWNGNLQAVGNGGWAGTISYPAMADALKHGYATTSTDTGHVGATGSFALGHPEKFVDFAHRSEHEMTVKAKAIIVAFYGRGPKLSYWNGCSTGGRQGLAEVQRYPDDFDGVVAGAQANPRTHLNAWQLTIGKAMLSDPAAFIPPDKYPLIHKAVLDQCDALDGLKDGLISDPTRCHFDPSHLDFLTPRQIQTLRTVMSPVKTKDGKEVFPGYAPGAELGWAGLVGGPEPTATAIDQYKYIVFKDPNWDWRTFDLDRDVAIADQVDGGTINAVNPHIEPFTSHGGKLLMYHGWADPLVGPGTSITYFNSLSKDVRNAVRLFMVPGMGHCGGGEGPNTFDMMAAMERWIEQGEPPERIVASHATSGVVDRTRPLCPYPQVATYRGSGSIDEAANFSCR
ncbi:MAG TPA: tannase/feruloyl esterase family alpha/beta hydrolase [Vicinamibacterales bacterium]|nr:tannase/feruloyl esterase family alpha/beta hydrolase [Vicinamibacterales bacterium]